MSKYNERSNEGLQKTFSNLIFYYVFICETNNLCLRLVFKTETNQKTIMKGTNLGEFQEIVLLSVLILDDQAYGLQIQKEISKRLDRSMSRGALHAALSRLEEKGFLESHVGGATAERGGRRKRFYTLTQGGKMALKQAKEIREEMWSLAPKFSI